MSERNNGNRNYGKGTEFVVRRYNYAENVSTRSRVLKKSYYPLFDQTDLPLGRNMKERRENDLELIREYFGEQLVVGARVVERFGKWYISQPDYGNKKLNNKSPELEFVRQELTQIFDSNDQMVRDTGFTVDMFGVEFWSNFGNYMKDPSYWSLDSFRITEVEKHPELRLVDTGLLWTRFDPPPEIQFINIHEPPAGWTVVNIMLPIVKERLSVKSS